jgi:hypothetical protein
MASSPAPAPAPARGLPARARTRLPAGTRVRIVAVAGVHPYFAGQEGTVWCADREGAVVALDGRRCADTRFTAAELVAL